MKKFLITIALIIMALLASGIDARRSRKRSHTHNKKHHKKQPAKEFINKHQGNQAADATHNFRVKAKFIKGAIQQFLVNMKFTQKEIEEVLKVPTKNIAQIMRFLSSLVKGQNKPEDVKNLASLLNVEHTPEATKKLSDVNNVNDSVKNIKHFFHLTRVIQSKKPTVTPANTHRRYRRRRR